MRAVSVPIEICRPGLDIQRLDILCELFHEGLPSLQSRTSQEFVFEFVCILIQLMGDYEAETVMRELFPHI